MKKIVILIFFLGTIARAQTIVNKQITIGSIDSLHSHILNEKQRFWVSLPTSYFNSRFAKSRYPVVYLFDGDANFSTVSAMTKQLSIRNGNSVLPEVIVVGIMNNDRSRDFTPYRSSFWIYNTPSPLENTGGGEKFVDYLQSELIPHIDSLYQTAPYKVLIGHSLGGLAVSNILVNHTHIFNAYIIIDPSMWYDNQKFLNSLTAKLQKQRFDGTRLYLGVANNLPPGMDTIKLLRDKDNSNLHMRSLMIFKKLLATNHTNGLQVKTSFYENDTHMSVPLITEYDGLRFIFNFYPLPSGAESIMFNPKNSIDPSEILTLHFKKAKQYLGYEITPPESLTNILANTMAENYLPTKALSLYQLNVQNYPSSYGAMESMGDFYKKQKDTIKAVEYYKRALKLVEVKTVRDKLNKLNEKQ